MCRAVSAGVLLAFWLAPEPALAEKPRPYVMGEVGYWADTFATAECTTYGLGAGLELGSSFDVSGGGRLFLGELANRPGFSGFLRAELAARWGFWRPAVGLELEAVSSLMPAADLEEIAGSLTRNVEAEEHARVRAGLVVAPLRAELARLRFVVAALQLATPLDAEAGQRVYVGLTLLRVGWPL
jgi:hypothetical protein